MGSQFINYMPTFSKMNKAIFTALFIFISINCLAQNQIIGKIFFQNQTKSEAYFTFLDQSTMSMESDGKIKKVMASEVEYVETDDFLYFPIKFNNEEVFFKKHLAGMVTVYELINSPNQIFAIEEDNKVVFIEESDWLAKIKPKILSTKKLKLIEMINAKDFQFDASHLTKLFELYNKLQFSKKENDQFKNKAEILIGFDIGMVHNNLYFSYLSTNRFYEEPEKFLGKSISPQFGLNLTIKNKKKSYFQFGLNHLQYSKNSLFFIENIVFPKNDTLDFNLTSINLPISYLYNLSSKPLSPYLRAGMQFSLNQQKGDLYKWSNYKTEIIKSGLTGSYGFHAGFGISKSINKSVLKFEYRLVYNQLRENAQRIGGLYTHSLALNYSRIMRESIRNY